MKVRLDTLLLKGQFGALAGIIVAQVLNKPALASVLFTVTFGLTLLFWLAEAGRGIDEVSILALLILLTSCISVAANALLTGTVVSPGYFKKLVMFGVTVLFFDAARLCRPEGTTVWFLFRVTDLLAVFLTGMFHFRKAEMYWLKGRVSVYLTFRFANPNLTAVFLSAICILEIIHACWSERKSSRLMHGCLAGYMAYFIAETQARNAQMVLLFFLIACLVTRWRPQGKQRMPKWLACVISVLPLVFAAVYLLLIPAPWVQNLFSFLVEEGKSLHSRLAIWRTAFRAAISSPLFGAYSQISGGTGASQLHNSHLDVMASYGIPVLGMLCVFLYRTLLPEARTGNRRMRFLCLAGFAAMLISGMGEAMLVSGGIGIYIFAGALQMLANFDFVQGGQAE